MSREIYKHTFTCTVLSEAADLRDLCMEEVAAAISAGDDIGSFEHTSTKEVPPDKVVEELTAVGNDGTFFQTDDDEEEGNGCDSESTSPA